MYQRVDLNAAVTKKKGFLYAKNNLKDDHCKRHRKETVERNVQSV